MPETKEYDFFPFSDMKLTFATWLYLLFEHLILVILAVVILIDAREYRVTITVFLIIQIIDTADYLLTYGSPWFPDVPITWNWIKIFVFALAILNEIRYGKLGNQN
jgi:hypothetical protein